MSDTVSFFGGIFLYSLMVVAAFLLAILGAVWINSLWSLLWIALWFPTATTAILAFVFWWDEL